MPILVTLLCETVIIVSPMLDLDYDLKKGEVGIYISNLVASAIVLANLCFLIYAEGTCT